MTRPAGDAPLIATTETFDDPADDGTAWDDAPTKVAPSAGVLAYGFHPDAPVSVEIVNHVLADFGARMRALDLAPYLNWTDRPPVVDTTPANVTPWIARVPHRTRRLVLVTNDDLLWESYDEGWTWSSGAAPLNSVFHGIAVLDDAVCAIYDVASAGSSYKLSTATDAWGSEALTGCQVPYAITGDEAHNCFWIVGDRTGGGAPGVWRVTGNAGATPSTITTVHPSSGTYPLRSVAASPDWIIAARDGTDLWRWADGDASATAATSPSAHAIKGLLWDAADELFFLFASNGAETEIWISQTGATGSWAKVYDVSGDVAQLDSCAVHGSFVCVVIARSSRRYILATKDRGATWMLVPDPLHHVANADVSRVMAAGNRLVAIDYAASGEVALALSLRAGEPL